jgi:protein gp37
MLQTSLVSAASAGHIWWGVSVENRKHGVPRIDDLRAAPARVRVLSIEPLLEDIGQIDLDGNHWPPQYGTPPVRAVLRALAYHSSSSRKRPA